MAILERHGPAGHDMVVLDESGGALSIGKNPENDLVIDNDPAVSRVHARLERIGPAWCISDLGSTNGTTVNGQPIYVARRLADRDEVLIGRTRLVLRDPGARGEVSTARIKAAPLRTPAEQRVLTELCRPVLSGQVFNPPASVRDIAAALYVGRTAVQQHLDHLYDKFGIYAQPGESRRVLLANEAIQSGAVTMKDLQSPRPKD